jgi:hypothetical protein
MVEESRPILKAALVALASHEPEHGDGWKLMPPKLTDKMREADLAAAEQWIMGKSPEFKTQAEACYAAVFASSPATSLPTQEPK